MNIDIKVVNCMEEELTYKKVGVDIEAGDEVVNRIKKLVKSTFSPQVVSEIGGFGGLFAFEKDKYKEPILVSSTDGVGSKLKIAFMMDRHDSIGIDLVAMGVNDVIVSGARPLFFLDYLGCHKVEPDVIEEIIKGIVRGCQQAGCALIGGETAELPDLYGKGEYDLAGFCVGVVEKEKMIDGSQIEVGDIVIGIASSGLHSNGYSLARHILFDILSSRIEKSEQKLGEELLKPTKIYVKPILELCSRFEIKGIVNITGGGLPGNLIRILPYNVKAVIDSTGWQPQPIFSYLEKHGKVNRAEMFRVFNMGIGMAVIVKKGEAEAIRQRLKEMGEESYIIGEIKKGEREVLIR